MWELCIYPQSGFKSSIWKAYKKKKTQGIYIYTYSTQRGGIDISTTWQWRHTIRGYHTSFFLFSENGEWGRCTLSLNGGGPIFGDWRMENEENFLWKVLLFFTWGCFFHLESTLQKSAWWMRKRTSNPSVWIKHKFLPHAGGNGNSHSSSFILHSPRATKRCHTFLHGEAILLTPLFPHSPFSILRGGVATPIDGGGGNRMGARESHG